MRPYPEQRHMRLLILTIAHLLIACGASAQWKVVKSTDPFTDERTLALMLNAVSTVPNDVGVPLRPALVIRCDGTLQTIYVVTRMYVDTTAQVQYRFGQSVTHTEMWEGGKARDVLFHPDPGLYTMAFLLLSNQRLVFRWFPPQGDSHTATFILSGLNTLPVSTLQYCGLDKKTTARIVRERLEGDSIAKQNRSRFVADSTARRRAELDSMQTTDSTRPWAGSRSRALYWRNIMSCNRRIAIVGDPLVYFRSAADAIELGYSPTRLFVCSN
jgi:hypothetical protein